MLLAAAMTASPLSSSFRGHRWGFDYVLFSFQIRLSPSSMADHCSGSSSNVSVAGAATAEDRISSLPEEILHHILSFLPMKHAIQTSILSNRWRYLWTFNPNLDFTIDPNLSPEEQETYIPLITRSIRLFNRPNINRLFIHLFTHQAIPFNVVETWIRFAIARGVHELILKICNRRQTPYLHLPEFLYFHTPLMVLELFFFIFNPPPQYKGFPFLKFIRLVTVHITDQAVQTLLITCPVLETLSIVNCDELVNLNISSTAQNTLPLKILEVIGCGCLEKLLVDAPNLVFFSFLNWNPIKIRLQNVPSLLRAHVSYLKILEPEDVGECRSLVKSMANVESLTVRNWFTQVLFWEYCMFRTPHITFMNLKEFHWYTGLIYQNELLVLATFLGDCPLLQKLCIHLAKGRTPSSEGTNTNRSRKKDNSRYLQHLDYALHHLKTIEIVGFSGRKMERELVGFLLKKAVVLDLLLLISAREDEIDDYIPKRQLQEYLSHLPKRSKHAKIVLSHPHQKLPPFPQHIYEDYDSDA